MFSKFKPTDNQASQAIQVQAKKPAMLTIADDIGEIHPPKHPMQSPTALSWLRGASQKPLPKQPEPDQPPAIKAKM